MARSSTLLLAAALLGASATSFVAFTALGSPRSGNDARIVMGDVHTTPHFRGASSSSMPASKFGLTATLSVVGVGLMALRMFSSRATTGVQQSKKAFVPISSSVSVVSSDQYVRDQLVACRAHLSDADVPSVEEIDEHISDIEKTAKQIAAGAASAVVFLSGMADSAEAYPIFAQQNYKDPREATGKLVCANCHLANKEVDIQMPSEVLPDTVFKVVVNVPAKYETKMQLQPDGTRGPMNIGAIVVMPEGYKICPKDRLPKVLKKEMKGLAWSPYSKEKPYIAVAGPVPYKYKSMVLPVLSPNPATDKKIQFGNLCWYFGANRGRGQVYPEGNQSNNNQFSTQKAGTIASIEEKADGDKVNKIVTVTTDDGEAFPVTVLPGAKIVVNVGDKVSKDQPITTNPNLGGFGQYDENLLLQDPNRCYGVTAVMISIFIAQLSFVLKKKQFEKVQLAEGF